MKKRESRRQNFIGLQIGKYKEAIMAKCPGGKIKSGGAGKGKGHGGGHGPIGKPKR